MDYKEKYEALMEEFEQYKKESIKWSIQDFLDYECDYKLTKEQAQIALEEMIRKHDCSSGITWLDLEYYIMKYGTRK
jgi:hypothetical protein